MAPAYWRIYLIVFYVIGVSITTIGKVSIVMYSLILFGILAPTAIAASLFTNDHAQLDQFVNKVRGLAKVMVAVIITALLFKILI
ncbi:MULTISPECIES: hypothetical protein [Paenibacillus]|uniref:Uncharacterized protein n=1 Tax=Paenibacillus xylanilyticus TaxID=248903 RepID=A0A7Y6EVF1_9BACL|nr:hypothetical protein [Paenibacillus xylanilyticus]NUU76616.1 hypothetical protein [Paenibacillus xylanilyticus]